MGGVTLLLRSAPLTVVMALSAVAYGAALIALGGVSTTDRQLLVTAWTSARNRSSKPIPEAATEKSPALTIGMMP
jgi:hypothetical protein